MNEGFFLCVERSGRDRSFLSLARRIGKMKLRRQCPSQIHTGYHTLEISVLNLCGEVTRRESSSVSHGSLAFPLAIDMQSAYIFSIEINQRNELIK
jgi:hypothetical protein